MPICLFASDLLKEYYLKVLLQKFTKIHRQSIAINAINGEVVFRDRRREEKRNT